MPTYGNAGSLSSLLSAASSARKRQETLQDSIASYEWDTSARSPEDYAKYAKFLQDRAKTYGETDPLKALEYQRKVNSTNSAFASAEISRASNQVLYGTGSNRDKYNTIAKLYQNALEAGDENLASRLEGQAARLSVTIQNELDAAARSAGAAGDRARTQISKDYDTEAKKWEGELKKLERHLSTGIDPEGKKSPLSAQEYIERKAQLMGQKASVFQKAAGDDRLDDEKRNQYVEGVQKMADDPKFKKLQYYQQAVDAAVGSNGQIDNSKLPFKFKMNNETGEWDLVDRKVTGRIGGSNPLDVFKSNEFSYDSALKGEKSGLDVQRNLDGVAGSSPATVEMQTFNSKDNPNLQDAQSKLGGEFLYYVDPVTGKTIVVRGDNTRGLLENEISTKEKNKADEEYAKSSAWENPMDKAVNFFNQYRDGALNGIGQSVLGAYLPGGGSILSGLVSNFGRQQEIDKIKAAQAEAERVKALEENRRQAAVLQANATKALAPLPVAAKATYNNGQGVKVAAPFDAMKAAAAVSKATGSAAPVVQTYLNKNPFGAANIYGNKL